eukprot:3839655-Rhodomonas_salina.1
MTSWVCTVGFPEVFVFINFEGALSRVQVGRSCLTVGEQPEIRWHCKTFGPKSLGITDDAVRA